MKFIDSHAHLSVDEIYMQIDAIIENAKKHNVVNIVNVSGNVKEYQRALEIKKKYPFVFNVAATHPHDVEKEGDDNFSFFKNLAMKKEIKAIGEVGLDYHYSFSKKEIQKDFLSKYFELALEADLPIVAHCRNAFEDFFELADKYYKLNDSQWGKLIVHCFSSDEKDLEEVNKRGWWVSYSGNITFKKEDKLREIVGKTNINKLLVETDCPFLAPEGKRGRLNEPCNVIYVAQEIAKIKNIDIQNFTDIVYMNFLKFFNK